MTLLGPLFYNGAYWETAVISSDSGPPPAMLKARTRTVYSVPGVSPVMVWEVPETDSDDASELLFQLPELSFHRTMYAIISEPPSDVGGSQLTSNSPFSPGETAPFRGAPGWVCLGSTGAVDALVISPECPASSVKVTLTLTIFPASLSAGV